MVCLGFEPGAAGWKARTNPLSYSGTRNVIKVNRLIGTFLLNWIIGLRPRKTDINKRLYESQRIRINKSRE